MLFHRSHTGRAGFDGGAVARDDEAVDNDANRGIGRRLGGGESRETGRAGAGGGSG
jgi:hypothetical protein